VSPAGRRYDAVFSSSSCRNADWSLGTFLIRAASTPGEFALSYAVLAQLLLAHCSLASALSSLTVACPTSRSRTLPLDLALATRIGAKCQHINLLSWVSLCRMSRLPLLLPCDSSLL
jgi:hypothetical protein